jgi:hypothetical protein
MNMRSGNALYSRMSGRLRHGLPIACHDHVGKRHLRELVAREIDLFCAPQLMSTESPAAAPNGGSASGYHSDSLSR